MSEKVIVEVHIHIHPDCINKQISTAGTRFLIKQLVQSGPYRMEIFLVPNNIISFNQAQPQVKSS